MSGEIQLTDDSYVGRRIDDLAREVRELGKEMLLREVYAANQLTIDMRISNLEKAQIDEATNRAADRRLVRGAILTFAGSAVLQIFTLIVTLTLR